MKKQLMPVITGSLKEPYEILDSVFAFAHARPKGFFGDREFNLNDAFDGVKNKLRSECKSKGGNAVIDCQFEYRIAVDPGIITDQIFEIFAYGTAVRSSISYIPEDQIYQLSLGNQGSTTCPVCNVQLKLDSKEINLKTFICPNCNNEIKFAC